MDLTQLKYFVKVSELRSVSKAAVSLHIAQPAVTRQIKLLEEELGVQLLFRHSRGVEPTEAGQRLKAGAETVFDLLRGVQADVVTSRTKVSGVLRIGFPPSLGTLLIGMTVAKFCRHYPDVELRLHEGYSSVLRDSLLGDRLDMAVLTEPDDNPLLMVTHLCDEQLWLMRPPGSASSRKRRYSIADICRIPLIQPSRDNILRRMIEDHADSEGKAIRIAMEVEALQIAKDLVCRGVGSHIAPFSGVGPDILRGEFPGGVVDDMVVSRFLVRRIDRPQSLAATRYQEVLQEVLSELQCETKGAIKLAH